MLPFVVVIVIVELVDVGVVVVVEAVGLGFVIVVFDVVVLLVVVVVAVGKGSKHKKYITTNQFKEFLSVDLIKTYYELVY